MHKGGKGKKFKGGDNNSRFDSSGHGVDTNREIQQLAKRIQAEAPLKGTNPIANGADARFSTLPLSIPTKRGLAVAGFVKMTDIQRAAIPHALYGRDILGAARTGSGKTLSFCVPLIELLYRKQWTQDSGLGALIISPTRELALQIFQELRKVGQYHNFSAGVITGGKELLEEKLRINNMNILVCTPGRLLQHMDQTVGFDTSNTQMLVLDEADRILEMGFADTLNAILNNLPKQRQTLLFSATQTKSIKDLARLNLIDPEYVSVYAEDKVTTPEHLTQSLLVVSAAKKLDTLWSFVKSHSRSKILIFVSTGKQTEFLQVAFTKLRATCKLYAINGNMHQSKRMTVFFDFAQNAGGVLIATDVAARGLDFPAVDWVVQMDCPESAEVYIHRVGRTARLNASGKALLFLTPQEEPGMMKELAKYSITLEKLKVNPKQEFSTEGPLSAALSKDPEFKQVAMKAFVTYYKWVFHQLNKEIFNIQNLPASELAHSMGLVATPIINIVQTPRANVKDNIRVLESSVKEDWDNMTVNGGDKLEDYDSQKKKKASRIDKLMQRKNTTVFSESYASMLDHAEEDDLFVTKKGTQAHEEINEHGDTGNRALSKRQRQKIKKTRLVQPTTGTHLKYLDDGTEVVVNNLAPTPTSTVADYQAQVRHSLKQTDKDDRLAMKKVKQLKKASNEQDEEGEGDTSSQNHTTQGDADAAQADSATEDHEGPKQTQQRPGTSKRKRKPENSDWQVEDQEALALQILTNKHKKVRK